MQCFPIIGGHHLNSVPGTAIEKRTVRSFADTFLTADTEIRIDFDAAKRRMVLVRDPKHAGFDRTVLNASWRTGAAGAAIRSDRQDARFLFARRLAIAYGHGPMFVYEVVHHRFP